MVMASLAWTLKAWFALLLPEGGRWGQRYADEKQTVLRMEFKTFLNAFMRIPCQVIRTGRQIVFRLMEWNPWVTVLLRGVDVLHQPMRSRRSVAKPGHLGPGTSLTVTHKKEPNLKQTQSGNKETEQFRTVLPVLMVLTDHLRFWPFGMRLF